MKPTIAYLVSHNYDEILERAKIFQDEFALIKPHFESLGINFIRVDWQDKAQDWKRYDCVIPKAVWNYFDEPIEFQAFLERLRKANVPMQNPLRSVQWNMNKRYLFELAENRVPTVAGDIHSIGSSPDESWFLPWAGKEILVKPAVSGGSKNTIRLKADSWKNHYELLTEVLRESDLIVQPFIEEVASEGEYSFFFFGGKFSHAIIKVPKKGDFRAHSFFGAELKPYHPTPEEIEAARHPLTLAPAPCTYARTDVVRVKGVLTLIELELIEPYLYMEYAGEATPAKSFAESVAEGIQS